MTQTAQKTAPTLEFPNVSEQPTGNHTAYSFVVSGEQIATYGRVFRHAESEDGVQRGKTLKTIAYFKQCMKEGKPLPQSMLANLGGDWEYGLSKLMGDEGMDLGDTPKSWIELLDGQHRMLACRELIAEGELEVVRKYSFTMVAFKHLDLEERIGLFMSQFAGQSLDSNLAMVLRAKIGGFASDTDRHAWMIVQELNDNPMSPLRGLIHMGETKDERRRSVLTPGKVKAASLAAALKSVTSGTPKNPLFNLSQDDRRRLVLNLFIAASKTFTNFGNPDHVLGNILGYSALIAALSSDGELTNQLGRSGYTLENLMATLDRAKGFQWTPRSDIRHRANKTPYSIAQRLNEYIRSH